MATDLKTGAQLLVEALVKQGVKYIFGIPGAKIDAVFDALLDSPIKIILCRHEQNAAFMAQIVGRLTGNPGVVLVTSGPGVSNLTTGLLTATTEGDPLIAIGGNVSRNMKHKQSHQNTNNIKLMESVTKTSFEILMTENIPEVVENAFRVATQSRRGAVFISLPQDITTELTNCKSLSPIPSQKLGYAPKPVIEQTAQLINQATFPIILLGLEASRPENTEAIQQLLKHSPLPVIGTYQAAGVISRELAQYFVGRVGLFKNQPGDILLDKADLVVTIGFSAVEYDPEIWNKHSPKKIIHIDYVPTDIHTDYIPCIEIIGDIALNLKKLSKLILPNTAHCNTKNIIDLQRKLQQKISSGASYQHELMHPLKFIHDLRNTIDDNTLVISDIGTHYMWLARYFYCYKPHHLLFSNGQQTLGVALPWAIAASLIYNNKPIISISGDGGFLFSATELETAVREKAHFVHCVWVDGTYNMVLEQQKLKYNRESAVHFGNIDIVKFAESFGAHGFKLKHSNEFVSLLQHAISLKSPVLIEIPIDYSDNRELFETCHESVGN